METRFYQTCDLDLQKIAAAVSFEYRAQGFDVHQFDDANQTMLQLRKDTPLRAVTGLSKDLGISLQRCNEGTLVQVGTPDLRDHFGVWVTGMFFKPILFSATFGVASQHHVVHNILKSIDQQVRRQQPQVRQTLPPANIQG